MTDWPPDRSRSRAVLIGTSNYSELDDIPAVVHSLARMQRLLTGPLCLWSASQVTIIPDQRQPGDLPDRLIELYAQAADVALFYYVGHGQIDDEGHLCLGLVDSRRQAERRATTSLTFDAVRRALRASPAAVKVVILDCCYAGQAVHGPHILGGQEMDITALTSATGAYTLAATGPFSTAWFESDQDTPVPHTHFTRHFAEVVERGIPGASAGLTLDPIYYRLLRDLSAAGKPVPSKSSRDSADAFVFARNAAPRSAAVPPPASAPAKSDPQHRFRLLDDAEKAACAIADIKAQRYAVIAIAREAARDDLDRVRRLLQETEGIVGTVEDPIAQANLWWAMADAVVDKDPAWARRLLDAFDRSITSAAVPEIERNRELALAHHSPALLRLDPERLDRLVNVITDQICAGPS